MGGEGVLGGVCAGWLVLLMCVVRVRMRSALWPALLKPREEHSAWRTARPIFLRELTAKILPGGRRRTRAGAIPRVDAAPPRSPKDAFEVQETASVRRARDEVDVRSRRIVLRGYVLGKGPPGSTAAQCSSEAFGPYARSSECSPEELDAGSTRIAEDAKGDVGVGRWGGCCDGEGVNCGLDLLDVADVDLGLNDTSEREPVVALDGVIDARPCADEQSCAGGEEVVGRGGCCRVGDWGKGCWGGDGWCRLQYSCGGGLGCGRCGCKVWGVGCLGWECVAELCNVRCFAAGYCAQSVTECLLL